MMRDMIWEIAKSGDEDLTNTELQAIAEPEELVVARGVSLEAKDSTTKINKFVDVKIANDVEDLKVRSTSVAWIPWDEWIPGIMHNMMVSANKTYFGYDLEYFQSKIQSTIYYGETNDFYDWHCDNDDASMMKGTSNLPNLERKLSCSFLLSDPDEYDGGEFEINYGPNFNQRVKPARGGCIVFPAWIPHRVLPVTRGRRISLVAWMMGPTFK
jgi:PKHD-type hydroxylase